MYKFIVFCITLRCSKMKDLLSISAEEFKEFVNSFDTVLTDIDGVLLNTQGSPIPNTVNTINTLKKLGKSVYYISNNCVYSPQYYSQILKEFNVNQDEIVIPCTALIAYLKQINFNKKIYALCHQSTSTYLESQGFRLADKGPEVVPENREALLQCTHLDPDVGAALIGFDINANYTRILKAAYYASEPDVLFICECPDEAFLITTDRMIIGPGGYTKLTQTIVKKEPIVFGKPSRQLFDFLVAKYDVKPERTLFIGDTLATDIKFAHDCGFIKLLALTGMNTVEDAEAGEKFRPDFYINSLGDMYKLLKII